MTLVFDTIAPTINFPTAAGESPVNQGALTFLLMSDVDAEEADSKLGKHSTRASHGALLSSQVRILYLQSNCRV